jgi:hypothetical protein
LGFVLFLLAAAGAVLLVIHARRNKRTAGLVHAVLLLSWFVVVLAFFSLSARKQWFYIMPLMPALAALGGFACAWTVTWVRDRMGQRAPQAQPRPALAAFAAGLLVAVGGSAEPSAESFHEFVLEDKEYGYGVKEAALYIHEQDADAIQIGTILGRFTLHYYNGQPAYHWYVDHDYVNASIERGELRYIVVDEWIDFEQEQEWMQRLITKYDGTLVMSYEDADGDVRAKVYELRPGASA